MKFNYSDIFVTLSTDKLQQMVDFYTRLFNQPAQVYRPSIYAEFQLKQLRLGIFQPQAQRQEEFANHNNSMSLCLEVIDLEQAIAYLTDLGYPPPEAIIEASHGREIYAYDPDGNRLIVHQSATKKPEIQT
ncbi:MAG: VOC family protein [Hydrococcus sp. SU_1_0]|nr:VOC family protein [Hydrococcus sp. SU_1_0]